MTIRVRKIVAPADCAITWEDGERLSGQLFPRLQQRIKTKVDFAHIGPYAEPFFNAAFGQLLKHFDLETVRRMIRFRNLRPEGDLLLDRVIENASDYFALDEERQRLVDEAIMGTTKNCDDCLTGR